MKKKLKSDDVPTLINTTIGGKGHESKKTARTITTLNYNRREKRPR